MAAVVPDTVISPIGAEGTPTREHADDVYDYIIKPLDLVMLKTSLKRCVERRALREQLSAAARAAEEVSGRVKELGRRLE